MWTKLRDLALDLDQDKIPLGSAEGDQSILFDGEEEDSDVDDEEKDDDERDSSIPENLGGRRSGDIV